jgi:uncharacterized repeat protein (TIGR01451 family)
VTASAGAFRLFIFNWNWLAVCISIAACAGALVPEAAWAGPATHFSVSAPASAYIGNAFSFTVTALDAANGVDTGYAGTVHFTSSDGAATLPANYTFVGGDAGAHTFSATLATSGSWTITATDTVTPSITGSSGGISVGLLLTDVAVTKSGPASVVQGQNATYSITVTNNGVPADNVSLTDALPAGLTFVSLSVPGGWTATTPAVGSGGTVTATNPRFANGASVTFTLVAQVAPAAPAGSTITNSATVSTTTFDVNFFNDSSASALIVALPPPAFADVAVTKLGPASVVQGQNATYSITVTNYLVPADNVSLTDVLPAGLTFVSLSVPAGWTATTPAVGSGGTVTATNPRLATGASATFTLVAQVAPAAPAGSTITNSATVSTTTFDVNFFNDSSGSTLTVGALAATADLSITKAGPASVQKGQTVTYTLTANNAGPAVATAVAITDPLPAGLTFASLTPAAGFACTTPAAGANGTINCTNASFANGASATFTLIANVTNGAAASVSNTATISSATPDINGANNSATLTTSVNSTSTSTTVTSSQNPSALGQSVTFTATVLTAAGTPTGNVTFKDGTTVLATVALSGTTAAFTTSSFTAGGHTITATYNGDTNFAASTSGALVQTVNQAATATALASSLNPSEFGKPVTFIAMVTSGSGTPTGTVTFNDGGAPIGTATLASGIATFTTTTLTVGTHTITASFGGSANFTASTSAALIQSVSTPADSLKLRALQVLVTPTVAQVSGQAISGAVDGAITEGFSEGGTLVAPRGSSVRFNFSADPGAVATDATPGATDPFASANGSFARGGRGFGSHPESPSRISDTFNALGYAGPGKVSPLRVAEPREWFGWGEVRGATLDRWGSLSTVPGATVVYGNQINLLAGLTRRITPNFLLGVLGGYETFDYRSDALLGRLKGGGWTVGAYLGWKITQDIRFDAAFAYSGIGYDGTAGTAAGSFNGNRWLVTTGVTGTYSSYGVQIEPSARVYALWERENAYTDTLGTLQTARDFATGRASGGVKLSYPFALSPTASLAPYVGLYGDYYFNSDSAGPAAVAAATIPAGIVIDGGSARGVGGMTAKFGNGAQIAVGAERSGIAGNFGLWTYRARAAVPFGAQ